MPTDHPELDSRLPPQLPRVLTDLGKISQRTRRPPTAVHGEKLKLLKRVAAECFHERGYAATDLRGIAQQLDLHVTSLYNYVSGKEELLYLIIKDGLDEAHRRLDKVASSSTDPVHRLRAAIRASVLQNTEHENLAWSSHVEVRSLSGAYLDHVVYLRHEYEERWFQLVADAISGGALNPVDVKVTVYGILGIGQSVARWYQPSGRMEADAIADTFANMILTGLVVDSAEVGGGSGPVRIDLPLD